MYLYLQRAYRGEVRSGEFQQRRGLEHKLEEFHLQMKDMEDMGTIERLSEQEVKDLENKVHHYNKLNFTMSSTSSSTPLRVLRDSTSKIPNSGGIFSVISAVASGIDIGDGLTSIVNHRLGQ